MERLSQSDIASVCEGRDDQSRCVTEVLVGVSELRIANVDVAVVIRIGPSSTELTLG